MLIGRPPVQVVVKGGSLYRLTIPRVTPGLPSELLFQRPDIRAAEADLASADASVESARAAFFPSISLTGQGGYQSNVLKLLFTPQNAFYNLAVNVTQPLLDGFRLEGQLELTQGRQFELLKIYCQSILAGFRDVELALIAIADGAERERLQQLVVDEFARGLQSRGDQAARGHGRSRHRAADPADFVYRGRQSCARALLRACRRS